MTKRWTSIAEDVFRSFGWLSAIAFVIMLIYFATRLGGTVSILTVVGLGSITAFVFFRKYAREGCCGDTSFSRYFAIVIGIMCVIVISVVAWAIWLILSAPTGKQPTDAVALLASFCALIVSLAGTAVSSVLNARSDARAECAEKRAQEKHQWEREDRSAQKTVEDSD